MNDLMFVTTSKWQLLNDSTANHMWNCVKFYESENFLLVPPIRDSVREFNIDHIDINVEYFKNE